ncbi:hypothetical protein GGF32_001894 [Allomyces javanicus]|nr:hypothetical protein GGF32_001894 [Allomyces javanicus]
MPSLQRFVTATAATAVALLGALGAVRADEHNHVYAAGDELIAWANTVGPYQNTQEVYDFFSLPFCHGHQVSKHKHETLGEALLGMDLVNLGLGLKFNVSVPDAAPICTATLTAPQVALFRSAILNGYRYQLFIDDLPVWGWVGQTDAIPDLMLGFGPDSTKPSFDTQPDEEPVDDPVDVPAAPTTDKETKSATADKDSHAVTDARDPASAPRAKQIQAVDPATARALLYTHMAFSISYNHDRIIHINLTNANPVLLDTNLGATGQQAIDFTYSLHFEPTTIPFRNRFDKYLDSSFFEHRVHWLSILNAFTLVVLLVGLVVVILTRALRRDFARYDNQDIYDLDRDFDDYGWKQVHADVFRAPTRLAMFSALLGSGTQLGLLALLSLLYSMADSAYKESADQVTAAIFIYALTSGVGGFVSTGYFTKYGGRQWVHQALLSASFLPATSCTGFTIINFVAISFHSSRAIAFTSILSLAAIFVFLVVPLTLLGSILGRHYLGGGGSASVGLGNGFGGLSVTSPIVTSSLMSLPGVGPAGFPCRVNPIPRPIPERSWHTHPVILSLAGGILPFASIFIELYFVVTSFFGYKIYYVYGFGLLALVLLAITTACCSIVVVYFLLNAEDHRWHWISFMASGSTALYIFFYTTYYYYSHTRMHGVLQFTFYFGYTTIACFAAFILLGTIGHFAASKFVHRIYANVKID